MAGRGGSGGLTYHNDGGLPVGGSGGTSRTQSSYTIHGDGWLVPVGGSGGNGGSQSRLSFQGDGIYPPVGGRVGAVDADAIEVGATDGGDASVR